ncbi:MAG: HAMP domain-containing histidine kinase [Chloroflexi bacterium]|nr:HAMP domain-containing histidine kinase [Chloroflexota bacterium]
MHGLRARLLLAHLLVIVVGLLTVYVAVSLSAPQFFAQHMATMARMRGQNAGAGSGFGPGAGGMMGPGAGGMMGPGMGGTMPPDAEQQVAESYRAAVGDALTLAALVALGTAVVTSLIASRELANPIARLAAASQRIARGEYGERVDVAGPTEIRQLKMSFNAMAAAVEDAERRRLELIGDVAHELRTPISTLEGYLEGLLDGVIVPSDELWAKLHTEAGRLRRLTEDLQQLSRAEAHRLEVVVRAVAPAGLVAPAVERLAPDFEEKGLALTVDVPPDLPPVCADPDRAIQVLTNLLTNALRYTPTPGSVAIRVEPLAGAVRFSVTDSGVGIAPEHLTRVFERFYRVDKSRSRLLGGAGVGLTIARAFVEAMDGRIWAESPGPGQGSTFTFELPRAPRDAKASQLASAP